MRASLITAVSVIASLTNLQSPADAQVRVARYDLSGSLRVQVSPRDAEVFVDGYFAGNVDDFDGVFQRLNIEPGEHEIEIYLAGHRSFRQRLYLQPGKQFNIKHTMEPLGPGEAAPPRPNGAPLASRSGYGGRGGPPTPDVRTQDDRRRPDDTGPGAGPDAVSKFGSLSLRVQPGDAEVLVDCEVWMGAFDEERLVIQLGAGTHHIEIRKDGYRSYLTDVSIATGQTRTLNVALTKQ